MMQNTLKRQMLAAAARAPTLAAPQTQVIGGMTAKQLFASTLTKPNKRFPQKMIAGTARSMTMNQNVAMGWDKDVVKQIEEKQKVMRIQHLEEQAMNALMMAHQSGSTVVFPNALIAGDVVITHMLHRLGLLENNDIKVLFVNTLHLFEETLDFIEDMEAQYNFKGHMTMAKGVTGNRQESKKMFDEIYGADLWKQDINQYDKVCKVEPFQRGLKELGAEVIITGRTRWQGAERAWLDVFEAPKKAGGLGNVNPIAHWTFEDTFNYISHHKCIHHPLHAKGYPSIGDAKDTIPIPEDGSVKFNPVTYEFEGDKAEWLGYGLERKGRFVGLQNNDGSAKTECGLHHDDTSEKAFDRDLWIGDNVIDLESNEAAESFDNGLIAVYAPWCQFCQKMEGEYQKLADSLNGVKVAKFRGDVDRDFSLLTLQAKTFPTIIAVKDGVRVKYESKDRSAEALQQFAQE